VIIGVLAAIAVPIFLNQKAKAQVAALEATVSALAGALAVGQSTSGTAEVTGSELVITDGAGATTRVPLSGSSTRLKIGSLEGTGIVAGTPLSGATWCVSGDNPSGGTIDMRNGATGTNLNGSVCYSTSALTTAASSGGVMAADVPTGLIASPANTLISLAWTAPGFTGGAPVTDYTVQYRTSPAGAWTTFAHTASATATATVTGLTNGTAYDFRVAAVNTSGAGTYSTTVTATPATAPGAPTTLAGTPADGQVALTWTAPGSTGGAAITDYTVQYRTSPAGSWATFADAVSATATATVTGLTNGTAYDFQVAAANAAATGAYSTSTTVTPYAPRALSYAASQFTTGSAAQALTPTSTGGYGTKTYAVTAGSLPAGVTLNTATGTLTGPAAAAWKWRPVQMDGSGDNEGRMNSCATLSSGEVKCWGYGGSGGLGNGGNANQSSPVTATALAGLNVTQVSPGGVQSCARLADGTARCWGGNYMGELGNGTTTNSQTPVAVSGLTNVQSITTNWQSACALLTSGSVKCWGRNTDGNLGIGVSDSLAHTSPETVLGITTATRLVSDTWAPTGMSNCVVLADTTVKCWGKGSNGKLGNGLTANQATPVAVTGVSGVTDVAMGAEHVCALLSGGTVKCWGQNTYGQLGNSNNTSSLTPVAVTGLTGVAQIFSGHFHMCARLTTGSIKCWGYNGFGELGNGGTTNSNTPVTVTGITTASDLASAAATTYAVLADGTLRSWGLGDSGLLGNGSTANSSTPVVVNGNWGNTQPGFPAAITITVTDTSGSTPTSFSLTNS
jgi:hypothetical protein